jgi:poly(3-hydroxybutyrate) depolymerase
MLYQLYELQHAAFAPLRLVAKAGAEFWLHESNPWATTHLGKQAKASLHLFERLTRRYHKQTFDISHINTADGQIEIEERVVLKKPFCRLVHFAKKDFDTPQKKLLIVAPMSGHHATLLTSTVEGMLPEHDVYLTDWLDARDVPVEAGAFDLDDYTDYLIEMLHMFGERAVIMAVCQPSVPVLAAVSLMAKHKDPLVPKAMILMGGPVDTRCNPTAVNKLAQEKGLTWFRNNVLNTVPPPHAGYGRKVYPGFLQIAGFLGMNANRHISAHRDLYWHQVDGDEHSARKIEEFYDEYLSVMDLTAEFYMQTLERVFINQDLAYGTYHHRGELISLGDITDTALLTVEGERDDITGEGQTRAAHKLCSGIPEDRQQDHLQKDVGHYGVFSGSRYLRDVAPLINAFTAKHAGV